MNYINRPRPWGRIKIESFCASLRSPGASRPIGAARRDLGASRPNALGFSPRLAALAGRFAPDRRCAPRFGRFAPKHFGFSSAPRCARRALRARSALRLALAGLQRRCTGENRVGLGASRRGPVVPRPRRFAPRYHVCEGSRRCAPRHFGLGASRLAIMSENPALRASLQCQMPRRFAPLYHV